MCEMLREQIGKDVKFKFNGNFEGQHRKDGTNRRLLELIYGFNLDKLGYVINFRDYGPGVPEHMQDRLFDPFFRVHIDRAQKHGGYGLGLSIAKRSIDLQGGNITATNHPDGGLEVSIFLPVELGS